MIGRRPATSCALWLLLAAAACGAPWDPLAEPDPARVAAGLFEPLWGGGDPPQERLEALFAGPLDGRRTADLLDALESLRRFPSPAVVRRDELSGPDDLYVELASVLPGGGEASFAARLRRQRGAWQVQWFQGPGVEWPRPEPALTEQLTTSSVPQ